jgi:hypothetical protein
MSTEDEEAERLVKVHVTLDGHPAGCAGESLWALPLDEEGLYEVRNVPYYTYGIHVHDVVRCELEDVIVDDRVIGQQREIIEVVRSSGWQTIRVMFQGGTDHEAMQKVVKKLIDLGGHPDLGFPGFLSLAVPPAVAIEDILDYLETLAEADMLGFETAEQRVEGSFNDLPDEAAGQESD